MFLILGVMLMGPKIVIDKEGAAPILALAWRCLYAETVGQGRKIESQI